MRKSRFTDEQIVGFLREVERGKLTTAELCKAQGVSETTFHRWKQKFGGLIESELKRLRRLEKENERLKELLVRTLLELESTRSARE